MYFDWAFTQYITQYVQKVRHGEMKVGTVKIVSTFKKSVFCPMGPNFWACLKVGILQYTSLRVVLVLLVYLVVVVHCIHCMNTVLVV